MADERNIDSEEIENWKPGVQQEAECSFDCSEDDEETDCCACCW